MSASARRAVIAVVVVLVILGGFSFLIVAGDDADEGGSDPSTAPTTSGVPSTTTTEPPAGAEVGVHAYFVRGEHVAVAGRTVEAPAVARGALEALLEGPDATESAAGMASAIPNGTELRSVGITDDHATVDLTGQFESGGGSLSMQLRVAQVVFTVTQFDTVTDVTITLDGQDVEAIGGEGVDATDLTRADVTGATPAILVESPVPGEAVTGPFEVTGLSNTFEATMLYELRDGAGTVVDDGFATATAGNGTWGTFAFTVDTAGAAPGPAVLSVWQEDAASGARADLYEVPVEV